MREGRGNCLRYLKRGGTEKRGRDKVFKKGGKLGQGAGVGCLKRGGGGVEPPSELWVVTGDFFCDYNETSL